MRDLDRLVFEVLQVSARSSPPYTPVVYGGPGSGKSHFAQAVLAATDRVDLAGGFKLAEIDRVEVIHGAEGRALDELLSPRGGGTLVVLDDADVALGLGEPATDARLGDRLLSMIERRTAHLLLTVAEESPALLGLHFPALARRLQLIELPEPSRDQLTRMAWSFGFTASQRWRVNVEESAVADSLAPRRRFETLVQPGLAAQRLDRSAIALAFGNLITNPGEGRPELVTSLAIGAERPVEVTATALAATLSKKVIGQEAAIEKVSRVVVRSLHGVDMKPERPNGVFLLAGPTGVGKTTIAIETARALKVPLVRFDLGEFQEDASIQRLIGPPPGFVGFDEPRHWLTTQVAAKPNCLLLPDEIDKASSAVHDLLLHIFDEGRLTDSRGRTTSFADVVVIATSNYAQRARTGFDTPDQGSADPAKAGVLHHLRAELVARIDAVIFLQQLSHSKMLQAAMSQLELVNARWKERGLYVSWCDLVPHYLAVRTAWTEEGVRPLRALIDQEITDRLIDICAAGGRTAHFTVNPPPDDKAPGAESEDCKESVLSAIEDRLGWQVARGQFAVVDAPSQVPA